MQVIDVDSHVTVTKGLEDTPLRVDILPDGGHSIEFNQTGVKFALPGGKFSRPGKEAILTRTFWDLNRRLEDLDRMLRSCRSAYEEVVNVPHASPHARFDIQDWMPLDL